MKKKLLSLMLALALCLGLVPPADAADASGLDAKTAQAYLMALKAHIAEYGLKSRDKNYEQGVIYACLEDMDGNGVPEMIVLRSGMDGTLGIDVWTMENGSASRGGTETNNYNNGGKISFARKNGQTRLFYDGTWGHGSLFYHNYGRELFYMDLHGNLEDYGEDHFDMIENEYEDFPPTEDLSSLPYDTSWTVDAAPLLAADSYWPADKVETVTQLQSALEARVNATNPAPGTYGPYMITGTQYTASYSISFTAAKVERTTIQLRNQWYIGGKLAQTDPYQPLDATVITLKAESDVAVFTTGDSEFMSIQYSLIQDGPGQYTYLPAALSVGEDFNMAFLSYDGNDLKQALQAGPVSIEADDAIYIIAYETSAPEIVSPATPSVFTDVKAGAYYEEAVKWAVENKVTSGTSATTFSPNDTCTIGQVLTFLWRANGSPEPLPMGGPAYVSSHDYYFTPVAWAYGEGMVPLDVHPDEPCTRAMAARFLWELAGSPAAGKSGGYAPYTISGELAGLDVPFTIQLDAASVEKATVTFCRDIDNEYGDYDEHGDAIIHDPYQRQVTVVRARPGSSLTVDSRIPESMRGGELEDGTISIDYFFADTKGVYHSDAYQTSVGLLSTCSKDYEGSGTLISAEDETYLIIASANTDFSDIPAVANYTQAVAWAVENGVTSGTGNGRFSPNDTCTRGQIVTFLHRALGQ